MMVDPIQQEDELARAGIFNLDDLAINRSGQLSDRQKRKFSVQLALWLGLATLYVIVMIALTAFFVAARSNIFLGLGGIAFLLILIFSSLEEAKPYHDDLRANEVRAVTGKLYKSFGVTSGSHRGTRIAHCNLRVQDQVFQISPAVYERVHEGKSYRIFYVENTRIIVTSSFYR